MSPTVYQPLGIDSFFVLSANEADDQAHTQSLIGIAVAVGGNILISLALNCQKLAHKRLDLEKQMQRESSAPRHCGNTGADSDQVSLTDTGDPMSDETHLFMGDSYDSYTTPRKTRLRPNILIPRDVESPRRRSALAGSPIMVNTQDEEAPTIAIEVTGGRGNQIALAKHADDGMISEEEIDVEHNETDYLRSKLWCVCFPNS